jgi:beta-mannosidase
VPGTAAGALRAAGLWDEDNPRDLDAEDWWFRTTFDAPDVPPGDSCCLCFDGLATLAEVWLNGRRVLTADNMFRTYRVDAAPHLRTHNELVLGFRSLTEALKRKRPRPRWKTSLVEHQQLRWFRTSLLGRIPGWSPQAPVVGPWRAVRLDTQPFDLSDLRLTSRVEGQGGLVTLSALFRSAVPLLAAVLQVGDQTAAVDIDEQGNCHRLRATLRLARVPLWWPHTHGEPSLLKSALRLDTGGDWHTAWSGKLGFRTMEVGQEGSFGVRVNGVPVYCRGACWTIADLFEPGGAAETVARDLRLACDAGANMLRVSGPMLYESDHFYRLCDELGILVWQDFSFANLDYPVEDTAFAANIEAEAVEQLARLAPHPCITVLCGNSEVEQQAAMRGAPRESWRNAWFGTRLPALCAEVSSGTAYVPSSPSGGPLPFHVGHGVAHYYGVGAYLRSPRELRGADVKFAAECLAFASVPAPETVAQITGGAVAALHHPRWKKRVPRDTGAGWDFDDVRDFYLRHLFGVDAVEARSFDPTRYLQLSRVVPGEMMAQVFGEWRGGHSHNGGGLVWFFKDLWPAAGWGILDSLGTPKAAYYFLRRSWLPRQITLTDEGLDGLHLHVSNETAAALHGRIELLLLKNGQVVVARAEVPCQLPPRGRQSLTADAVLDGFNDVTYAYRFGPPQHDVVIATLLDDRREVLSEAFYYVRARDPAPLSAVRLEVEAKTAGAGGYQVALRSDHFLQGVSLEAGGFLPDDNYFHLPPGRTKVVRFTARGDGGPRFRATLEALNLRTPVTVRAADGLV